MTQNTKRGNARGEFNNAGKVGNPNLKKTGNGYAQEMRMTEERLSETAKIRRRLFASHYIKTTNATSAATFAGFSSPGSKGHKLLHEPYVQALIAKMLNAMEMDAIITQQEVLFRFKEEANNLSADNQGARISALAHIAKIHGMMIDRQETNVVNSGVMIVPALVSADEWGKLAADAQARLKDEVKD